MLVSTIITNGQALADVPNTSFYTASEALFAVQLAWEQVYAFLASNNDDYFVTPLYLNRTVETTGTFNGTDTVTGIPSTTGMYGGTVIAGTYITAGTTIGSVDSSTQITMSDVATGNGSGTITAYNVTDDTNRTFASLIDTTNVGMFADGFFRLRMIQYQGMGGNNAYLPVQKMTIENFGNTQNAPAYRFEGPYIAIYDPAGYTKYCLWYYPRPVTLITTTDLSYPYNMIPEVMAYQLAAEIRRKQKADVAPWTSRVQELYASMAMQMSRDDSHGEPIKNQFAQGFAPYI
jgi:hypothetical protein